MSNISQIRFDSLRANLGWAIFKNVFLSVVTFGFYIPFAKTELRQIVWSNSQLDGHAFHFGGDPWKLFRAYLVILAAYFFGSMILNAIVGFLASILSLGIPFLAFIVGAALTFAFYYLLYTVGSFLGLRYLVNYTRYRNIRCYMQGTRLKEYVKTSLLGSLLTGITLGFYYPYMSYDLKKIRFESLWYGNRRFEWRLERSSYVRHYFLHLSLTVLTFGLYYPWFYAQLYNVTLNHLFVGEAKCEARVSGTDLLFNALFYFFVILITFGIGAMFGDFFFIGTILRGTGVKDLEKIDFADLKQAPQGQDGELWDSINEIIPDSDFDFPV